MFVFSLRAWLSKSETFLIPPLPVTSTLLSNPLLSSNCTARARLASSRPIRSRRCFHVVVHRYPAAAPFPLSRRLGGDEQTFPAAMRAGSVKRWESGGAVGLGRLMGCLDTFSNIRTFSLICPASAVTPEHMARAAANQSAG